MLDSTRSVCSSSFFTSFFLVGVVWMDVRFSVLYIFWRIDFCIIFFCIVFFVFSTSVAFDLYPFPLLACRHDHL